MNSPFDPTSNVPSWNFYANIVKIPTLFDVIHAAGKITAAVTWPVMVGSKAIDYNFPDYWGFDEKTDNIALIRSQINPPNLLDELEANALGKVSSGEINSDDLLRTDENASRIAAYLFTKYKPALTAVHFIETDHAQHDHGREGYEVRAAVAAVDRAIGAVLEAVRQSGMKDSTTILICCDHGFSDIHSAIEPNIWLAQTGLFHKGTHWRSKFQSSSGSAFLHLEDKKDTRTLTEVLKMLNDLPEKYKHLFRVLQRPELDRLGTDSSIALALAPVLGVAVGNASEGEILRPAHGGTHGFMNDEPQMFTGFIAYGAGISKGTVIPEMGTQDVAPLMARLLGLDFPCPDGILYPGLIKK